MLRVLIALFWISLIIGTLVAHSVVANWAVTLVGCYFGARWWVGRRRAARVATAPPHRVEAPAPAARSGAQSMPADTRASGPVRSRWTVDRVHAADRPWH
jgi:hypothetical protein